MNVSIYNIVALVYLETSDVCCQRVAEWLCHLYGKLMNENK